MSEDDEIVTERYSHNPEFVWSAWSLYSKGFSVAAVAKMIKPEWPDVSVRTLQRIAREQGWEESRANFMALYTKAMSSVDGVLPEVILNLQRMRAQLESRPSLSHAEIFAYRALVEDLLWYTGKHPKQKDDAPMAVSDDREVAALLEAIQEDEVVSAAWKKRRRQILKVYEEKLASSEKKQKGKKGY